MVGDDVSVTVLGVKGNQVRIGINAPKEIAVIPSIIQVLCLIHEREQMRNRRLQFDDRRHKVAMPRVPFKDSNGATITESRRKIPDRRINNIHTGQVY